MSIQIKTATLSNEIKQQIHKDLTIEMIDNYTLQQKDDLYTYTITGKENDEILYAPYAYAYSNGYKANNVKNYPKANFSYKKEYPLREKQIEVKKEAVEILNKNGSIILALYTGFGKTALSLYLASVIGLKTVYINNNLAIINQIADSVKKFTNGKCQILTPKSIIDPECDIYIINAINIPKFPEGSFDHIGLVIIDEVHCILSKVFSKCLFCFTPRYLVGLSATPYREDSMNILFDLYFGQENKIEIKLDRQHIVYKINTPIKPYIMSGFGGRLDWNGVLKSLADNKIRNDKIVEIIENVANNGKPHLNIGNGTLLVIFKFVEQVKIIEEKLKEKNVSVDSLYGSKKKFNVDAKVLLGTLKKVGVGFDHPKINSLFPVCDIQAYYKQVQGRCMRTPDVQPIFIEMVDNFHVLFKHWLSRKEVYEEHGGIIKNMDWDTLEIIDGNNFSGNNGNGKNNRAIVQVFTFPKKE
jgi:superfamily II DNA or RNA helicase